MMFLDNNSVVRTIFFPLPCQILTSNSHSRFSLSLSVPLPLAPSRYLVHRKSPHTWSRPSEAPSSVLLTAPPFTPSESASASIDIEAMAAIQDTHHREEVTSMTKACAIHLTAAPDIWRTDNHPDHHHDHRRARSLARLSGAKLRRRRSSATWSGPMTLSTMISMRTREDWTVRLFILFCLASSCPLLPLLLPKTSSSSPLVLYFCF